jgi:hypothetical protein
MPKVIPIEIIENKIFIIRNKKVMLDSDLALLYEVETKRLNEQIKRNLERFPEDFMFQLTKEEWKILRSQFATLDPNLKSQFATSSWGGIRKSPYAFTENGVAMLSSVLNSQRAIQVSIQIMRTFTRLKKAMLTNEDIQRVLAKHATKLNELDKNIKIVFQTMQQILIPATKSKKIGFLKDRESR